MAIDCKNCKAYCCRRIGLLRPELDRGDKICKHLDTQTNQCRIYQERPLICNTDRLYEAIYKDIMTKEEWVNLNKQACQRMENEDKETNKEEESNTRRED